MRGIFPTTIFCNENELNLNAIKMMRNVVLRCHNNTRIIVPALKGGWSKSGEITFDVFIFFGYPFLHFSSQRFINFERRKIGILRYLLRTLVIVLRLAVCQIRQTNNRTFLFKRAVGCLTPPGITPLRC